MTDLHPTSTRLALLQAVADGAVFDALIGGHWVQRLDHGPGVEPRFTTVKAAIAEMQRADWVEPGPDRMWAVTAAGQAVLDAAGGAS